MRPRHLPTPWSTRTGTTDGWLTPQRSRARLSGFRWRCQALSRLYGGDGSWACQDLALLFGSEAVGLSERALACSDMRLSVPHRGLTQSLNVATCAAIVLGETLRLREAMHADVAIGAHVREELEAQLETQWPAAGRADDA